MSIRTLFLLSVSVALANGCVAGTSSAVTEDDATTGELKGGVDVANGEQPGIGRIDLFGIGVKTAANPNGGRICTGALIAPQIVLTSARCFEDSDSGRNVWGEYYQADRALGKFTTFPKSGPNDRHVIDGFRIIANPDPSLSSAFFGIALVHLSVPVSASEVPPTLALDGVGREPVGWKQLFSGDQIYGFGCIDPSKPSDFGKRRRADVSWYAVQGSFCSWGDIGATVLSKKYGVMVGLIGNAEPGKYLDIDYIEKTADYGETLRTIAPFSETIDGCGASDCSAYWPLRSN